MANKYTLTNEEIIRAWKDRRFRESLSDEQKLELLDNPIGAVFIDLRDRGAGSDAGDDDDTCALNTTFCIIISETFGTTCPAPKDEATSSGGSIGSFVAQYGTFYCPSE